MGLYIPTSKIRLALSFLTAQHTTLNIIISRFLLIIDGKRKMVRFERVNSESLYKYQ